MQSVKRRFCFSGEVKHHWDAEGRLKATEFSLLRLWHQAEAVKRLYGVTHDGNWCHVAMPQALAEVERAIGQAATALGALLFCVK